MRKRLALADELDTEACRSPEGLPADSGRCILYVPRSVGYMLSATGPVETEKPGFTKGLFCLHKVSGSTFGSSKVFWVQVRFWA